MYKIFIKLLSIIIILPAFGQEKCNGHSQLCNRRYDQVAYAFSHNGTSLSPSLVNNQDISLEKQMAMGVRGTKLPIHFQKDLGGGKGENPMACHGVSRQFLEKNYGEIIASKFGEQIEKKIEESGLKPILGTGLHAVSTGLGKVATKTQSGKTGFRAKLGKGLRKVSKGLSKTATKVQKVGATVKAKVGTGLHSVSTGLGKTVGQTQRFSERLFGTKQAEAKIAFRPCILDFHSQPLKNVMLQIKSFLDKHPREVFTLKLEVYMPPIALVAQVIKEVGLANYAFEFKGQWPTLGEMIRQNKRLVIFSDETNPAFPWINAEENFLVSTPYSFKSVQDILAAVQPIELKENQLLEVQHFITTGLAGNKKGAQKANSSSVLRARLKALGESSKHIPNFIEVDFIEQPNGDVFDVVNHLNGVGKYAGNPLLNFGY